MAIVISNFHDETFDFVTDLTKVRLVSIIRKSDGFMKFIDYLLLTLPVFLADVRFYPDSIRDIASMKAAINCIVINEIFVGVYFRKSSNTFPSF